MSISKMGAIEMLDPFDPPRLRRTAADVGRASNQTESSAYPGSTNFDPEAAQAVMGDLAEAVRDFLSKRQKARPPGLETISNPDGTMVVRADNPEVGIGLQVVISLLNKEQPAPAPAPAMGVPGAGTPGAPAPTNQPPMQVGPPAPAPAPAPEFQVGPTPTM